MKFENPNLSPEAVRPQCVMVRYCVVPMGRLKWNLGCVIGMGKEIFRLKSNDFYGHTIMQILHSTHSLLNRSKNRILGKDYTANIYSGKWDTRKKCKSYKYLP